MSKKKCPSCGLCICTPTCLTGAASTSIFEIECNGNCYANSRLEWEVTDRPASLSVGDANYEGTAELIGSATGTTVVDNAAINCAQTLVGIRYVSPQYTAVYNYGTSSYVYTRHTDYTWETLTGAGLPAVSHEYTTTVGNRTFPTGMWTSVTLGAAQQSVTVGEIAWTGGIDMTGIIYRDRLGVRWLSGRDTAISITPTAFTAIGQNGHDTRTIGSDTNTSGSYTDTFYEATATNAKVLLELSDATLIDGAGATNPGCVNCYRVIDVHIEVDYNPSSVVRLCADADPYVIADGIYVQKCKAPGETANPFECEWYSGSTSRIRRLAPNLYTLEDFYSSAWHAAAYWRTDGDCPYNIVDAMAISGTCFNDYASGALPPFIPIYDREFKAFEPTITITEVTDWPEGVDFCACDCLNAPDIFQVTIKCNGATLEGFPTIEVTRTTGCNWEGVSGGWRAELSYDTSTGLWSSAIYRVADGLLLLDAVDWEAAPTDPTGFHTFSGGDTGYPDPDGIYLDETCGESLGIQIS